MRNFIEKFENSIKENWNNAALTDYRGETWTYSQIAEEITMMHLVWRAAGIRKGDNTFFGYYKNPEADREVFTSDGWFRTGDLGTLDSENTLFLVGRCKSMLLASNGQNVYPEEIEVKLNVLPYVAESIIVQRGEKFVALVVPNADQLANDGVSAETLKHLMEKNIATLNTQIPAYSFVSNYELREEPFAKTPKGSIKRFMYS